MEMKQSKVMEKKLKISQRLNIGFDHVWQNKGTFSKGSLINAVEKKLIERYNPFFKEAITGRITVNGRKLDKLRAFKMFKNKYKMESYLSLKVDKHLILNLLNLEFQTINLTGQYKKTRIDQRLCKICNENGCVEDEFHFLMICKEYQAERIEFCRKINRGYSNFWNEYAIYFIE